LATAITGPATVEEIVESGSFRAVLTGQ